MKNIAMIIFTMFASLTSLAQNSKSLSSDLLRKAIQLHELEGSIYYLYAEAFPETHYAGEGISHLLYNDPLIILDLAIKQDSSNLDAYYWKARILHSKSNLGEGSFHKRLLVRALESLVQYEGRASLPAVVSALRKEIQEKVEMGIDPDTLQRKE
jgi:hypothetical protein